MVVAAPFVLRCSALNRTLSRDKITRIMYDGIDLIGSNNQGRSCAPSPFSTSYRPSGVSDPIKLSTSWLVVLAEGLRVWANDKVATLFAIHPHSNHLFQ